MIPFQADFCSSLLSRTCRFVEPFRATDNLKLDRSGGRSSCCFIVMSIAAELVILSDDEIWTAKLLLEEGGSSSPRVADGRLIFFRHV